MIHEEEVATISCTEMCFFGEFTHKMREVTFSFITTVRPSGILGSHWNNVPEILYRVFY
jgi:hypothetical protein